MTNIQHFPTRTTYGINSIILIHDIATLGTIKNFKSSQSITHCMPQVVHPLIMPQTSTQLTRQLAITTTGNSKHDNQLCDNLIPSVHL